MTLLSLCLPGKSTPQPLPVAFDASKQISKAATKEKSSTQRIFMANNDINNDKNIANKL